MKRHFIDACGLRCPLPLLKLKQGIAQALSGDELVINATDAGSWRDIPAFVNMTQHVLIEQTKTNDVYCFTVVKGE